MKLDLDQIQNEFQLSLCQRDYSLLEEYHPDILSKIEAAIGKGVQPRTIGIWAKAIVFEEKLVRQCVNAARYLAQN